MIFAPKIASFADTLARIDLRQSFGGGLKIILSFVLEVIFSIMIAPIMAIANTVFLVHLFVFGKAKAWGVQSRTTQSLPFKPTALKLLPQTIFGITGLGVIFGFQNPSLAIVLICLPVFIGPILAIPFALITSYKGLGTLFAKLGLCQIPEENHPPVILRALELEAISIRVNANNNSKIYQPLTTEDLLKLDIDFDVNKNLLKEQVKVAA